MNPPGKTHPQIRFKKSRKKDPLNISEKAYSTHKSIQTIKKKKQLFMLEVLYKKKYKKVKKDHHHHEAQTILVAIL